MYKSYNSRNTNSVKPDGPCKGCSDRHMGCHGKCLRYIDWKQEREVMLVEKRKETDIEDALITLNRNNSHKMSKHRHRR